MKPAADEEPDPWEQHALWWRDNFTEGADAEYEELILPLLLSHLEPGTNVLDLGCGEGQVSRMAAVERGCAVLGVDPAAAQLAEAAKARRFAVLLPRKGDEHPAAPGLRGRGRGVAGVRTCGGPSRRVERGGTRAAPRRALPDVVEPPSRADSGQRLGG